MEAIFRTRTTNEWVALCAQADVPAGPVNTVDRALNSPQALARDMVQSVDHPGIGPVRMVASPLKYAPAMVSLDRNHEAVVSDRYQLILNRGLGAPHQAFERARD